MKTLLLLRHAKSSWDNPSLGDFERPLAPRGEKDAPRIGKALRDSGCVPDLVLSSPAVRARTTAGIVLEAARYKGPVRFDKRIYEASEDELMEVLRSVDPAVETVMLVGHNPGFEMLAGELIGSSGASASVRVPTAALLRLELSAGGWGDVRSGCGALLWLVVPRCLSR